MSPVTGTEQLSAVLKEQIDSASSTHLRTIVLRLCVESKQSQEIASQVFAGRTPPVVSRKHPTSDDTESQDEEAPSKKPRTSTEVHYIKQSPDFGLLFQADGSFVPRYAECRMCHEDFDVNDNIDRDCWYHEGKSSGAWCINKSI